MQDMFLETERLYLRRMSYDDFAVLNDMLSNPKVMYAWEYTFSEQDVKDWISKNLAKYQKHSLGYFLVCDKTTTQVLGQAALMPDEIDGRLYYEIGYIFKPENWHKGYAAECVKFLADYAFTKLNVNEVIFEIKPDNIASIKVAEKSGAKVCGSFYKNVRGKRMKHLIFKLKNS